MSTKKKREPLQRNRTDQILEAAEKLFAQKGFYSTTVGEIAEKAGIAKGTIYLYFRDKRDLFFSVRRESRRAGRSRAGLRKL